MFFTNKRNFIEILDKTEEKARKFGRSHTARMQRTVGNCRPVFMSVVVLTKDMGSRPLSCVRHVVQLH